MNSNLGLLYESCVEFCQRRALSKDRSSPQHGSSTQLRFGSLLNSTKRFHDSDLSLLSWLQSIPAQTFVHPFEQRSLDVDVERLEKPALETSWTEHMLVMIDLLRYFLTFFRLLRLEIQKKKQKTKNVGNGNEADGLIEGLWKDSLDFINFFLLIYLC